MKIMWTSSSNLAVSSSEQQKIDLDNNLLLTAKLLIARLLCPLWFRINFTKILLKFESIRKCRRRRRTSKPTMRIDHGRASLFFYCIILYDSDSEKKKLFFFSIDWSSEWFPGTDEICCHDSFSIGIR